MCSARCPLCHKEDENWKHVYRCPCVDMKRCKRENIAKIEKQLHRLKTLPQITEHFVAILSQSFDHAPSPTQYPTSPYMHQMMEAHKNQEQIGYQAFLKGFLTKKWYQLQETYYRNERMDRKYNSKRWRKEVVRLIINFGNELWNERCSIINSENSTTDDQLYRKRMHTFSLQMKQQKHLLNPRDQHLVIDSCRIS